MSQGTDQGSQTDQGGRNPSATGPVGEGDHIVEQGECVESIAYRFGLDWKKVWEAPENAKLKEARKNPNALLPGDRVHVPDKTEKLADRSTGSRHRFRRLGVPSVLKLQFKDAEGNPRASEKYTLKLDDNVTQGSTDPEGRIEARIMPDVSVGSLTLGDVTYKISPRRIDPVEENGGIQARLANLGFDPGPVDGALGERSIAALRSFQAANELEPTGEPDPATLDKLRELFGN